MNKERLYIADDVNDLLIEVHELTAGNYSTCENPIPNDIIIIIAVINYVLAVPTFWTPFH